MGVQLNHTLVNVRDKRESATFVADVLGLASPTPYGPFLVGEREFDEILDRIRERGLYWEEPSGHLLEIITRPYGSGG
jgi:hypothetical protein